MHLFDVKFSCSIYNMKHTVGQIKRMLEELDTEFPEIDENERAADRAQTIRLMAVLVKDWKDRGYSYFQIAEKLRMKGLIQISEKSLRQAVPRSTRKPKAASRKASEKGEAKVKTHIPQGSSTKLGEAPGKDSGKDPEGIKCASRSSGFSPRQDTDDI